MSQSKHFLEKFPIWDGLPVPFFSDTDANSIIPESHSIFTLISKRSRFKEFCISRKIPTPTSFCSDRFDKISAWAIGRNRFPMVLKTENNLCDGQFVFLLKAFRELPEFHEIICQTPEKSVIIEDFVQAKANIEVTTIEGKCVLISQFSLERSMRMRHSWRAFPIILPAGINKQISAIIAKFPELDLLKNIPIRFSFALSSPEIKLLAINSGFNRPEYSPAWTKNAGLAGIFNGSQIKSSRLFKVLCFHSSSTTESSEDELRKHCGDTLINYSSDDSHTIIMLGHADAAKLQETGKWVSGLFMQAKIEPVSTNEKDD